MALRAAAGGLACAGVAVSHRRRRIVLCQGIWCQDASEWKKEADKASEWKKARFKRDDLIFINKRSLEDEYTVEGKIGSGRWGEIFIASHKRMNIKRAIKQIPMSGASAQDVGEEVRALIGLDHPHIVKAIEYFEDDNNFYLVQELCTGPDLFAYIEEEAKQHTFASEKAVSIILRQVLKAVVCCHANGYIHRDLKPENFMVTGKDNTVKMIDFGLATRLMSAEQLTRVTGTLDYMAPEMLQNRKYNNAADLWSVGVLVFVLLYSEHLLPDDLAKKKDYLKDPAYVPKRLREAGRELSEEARDFLAKMLEYDPARRITASSALSHPFILAHWGESLGQAEHLHSFEGWRFDRDIVAKLRSFAESPRLRKIALVTMAHLATAQAHDQDLLEARHTFRFIDQDGDGRITCAQLAEKLQVNGLEVPADLEDIFGICDGGSSGALSYVEFVACCFPASCLEFDLCAEAFNLLNQESNGRITSKDLEQLCRSHRYISREYSEMIREVDPVGKGYIDLEDFERLLRRPLATGLNGSAAGFAARAWAFIRG